MKNYKLKTTAIVTQKELENGIWQFLIDHSVPYEKDLWLVKYLQISTKEDLMRRIYSRATGLYKVKDEEKIKKELEKKVAYLIQLEKGDKIVKIREEKILKLRLRNKLKYNFILFLRRTINTLIHKWTNEI